MAGFKKIAFRTYTTGIGIRGIEGDTVIYGYLGIEGDINEAELRYDGDKPYFVDEIWKMDWYLSEFR